MRTILFLTITVAASGCMSFAPSPFQKGNVVLAGDAEGVEALMDGLNGFVTNGHTQDPVGDSAHWRHRKEQESQRTRRSGIFQKLTSTEK